MTRHGSSRPRHLPPYQATTISQSATQLQQSALHRLRNPWAPGDCHSTTTTHSSSSSRTYHGIPSDGLSSPIYHSPLPEEVDYENDPFSTGRTGFNVDSLYNRNRSEFSDKLPYTNDTRQYYVEQPHFPVHYGRVYPEDGPERRYFHHNERRVRTPETEALYQGRYAEIDRPRNTVRNYLDDHGRVAYQQPINLPASQRQSFRHPSHILTSSGTGSERTASPGGLIGRGAVDGCGGHCIAFQNFCYYFLQVIFVIGILTGISLCIAGSVLRRNRGKDLSVLVYIGCLISMVCAVLLSIQYCVRRNVERRKKALRSAMNAIPMGDLVVPPTAALQPTPGNQLPAHILLPNSHSQIPSSLDSRGGFPRDTFRSGMSTVPIISNEIPDQNGIPWWRRDPNSVNNFQNK